MAATGGRKTTSLEQELSTEPFCFSFFQAVRLLERMAPLRAAVGHDARPGEEVVSFRATPTAAFAPGEISALSLSNRDPHEEGLAPAEMWVNFLGLMGTSGALPRHYTALVIERAHPRHKDYAMREFFDLFNHRAISLFYRAWEKYRFPFGYERAHRDDRSPNQEDLFTECLYCLAGLGTDGLRNRFEFDDETTLYYGAYFARRSRCAISLQEMLSDWSGVPMDVRQFQGQWLYLSVEDQTSFPSAALRLGRNLELGMTAIAGSKVWDVQGKLRVRIGPLDFPQFSEFLPQGARFRPLCQLVRLYVGPEFDFDVQLVLKANEVPWCQFSSDPQNAPRLGWNTWIRSNELSHDVDDAVFVSTGFDI